MARVDLVDIISGRQPFSSIQASANETFGIGKASHLRWLVHGSVHQVPERQPDFEAQCDIVVCRNGGRVTEESILNLASQIQSLRDELASKLSAGDTVTELKVSLAAIAEKISLIERISKLEQGQAQYLSADKAAELRTAITAATERLAVSERLGKIEEEHNSWKTLAKYLSITAAIGTVVIGILGAILGWLGLKSFDSIVHSEIDRRFSFYSDLSNGLAYHDKFPASAIPYLQRCFEERPFEEPVVAALLLASDNADNWDAGQIVLDRLARDPTKATTFRDPITYNLIGVAALNLALARPEYRSYAERSFEQGMRIVTPDNLYAIWYLHFNKWRLLFANQDSRADQEIALLKKLNPPADMDSWEKARTWKWFTILRTTNPKLANPAEAAYRSILPSASTLFQR